jgi:hypothetical protein
MQASGAGTKSRPADFSRNRSGRNPMKRILLALAGYAFYRWWNSQPERSRAPSAPPKRTPPRRQPVNPG